MNWFTSFAIYFIIWWLCLFITLPFRVKTQQDEGNVTLGTEPSAPVNPMLGKRLFWNSVVSLILLALLWFATEKMGLGFDDIPKIVPDFS